jgi:hypothetical protein
VLPIEVVVDAVRLEHLPEDDHDGQPSETTLSEQPQPDGATARSLRLQQPFAALGSRVARDRAGDATDQL